MKLKNTAFKIDTAYDSGIDKYDMLQFPQSQSGLVIRKFVNGEQTTLTVIPFKLSKRKLWNRIRFFWIRVRVFFNFI